MARLRVVFEVVQRSIIALIATTKRIVPVAKPIKTAPRILLVFSMRLFCPASRGQTNRVEGGPTPVSGAWRTRTKQRNSSGGPI